MKFSILLNELKIFSRCIVSLSKLGDDIYLEWENNELSLRTVNCSRSAFGRFQFKSSFFEKVTDVNVSKLSFKLSVKQCLAIFRPTNLGKTVERCKLILNQNVCNVIIQLFCESVNDLKVKLITGISKTYNLNLIECESLQAKYSIMDSKNILTISTKLFLDMINNFQSNHEELSLTVDSATCTWSTFVEDSDISKIVFTKMCLNLDEFDEYDIYNGIEVIMCHKELRAAVTFGENSNYKIHMSYSDPGKPFIFSYLESSFKAHFVLATLANANKSLNSNIQSHLQKSRSNITPSLLDFDDYDEELDAELMNSTLQAEEAYLTSTQSRSHEPISQTNMPMKRSSDRLFSMFRSPNNEKIRKVQEMENDVLDEVLVEDSDEDF